MGQVGQRTQHQSGVSSWAILDVEKVVQDYISQQIFVDGDRMWKEFGKPCGAADHSELRPQPIDPAVPDRASIRYAWHGPQAARRREQQEVRTHTAALDDAIDPVAVDFSERR